VPSELDRAAARFRAQLARREGAAVATMRATLERTQDRIDEEIGKVLAKIRAAEQRGRQPGISFLYERGRLEQLRREVQQEMAAYAPRGARVATGMVDAGAADALDFSRRFIEAAGADAGIHLRIPSFRPELVERARANLSEGSPLAELFGKFGPDAARRVEAGLVQGLALGQNPAMIARRIRADVVETYTGRAQLIARTETHRIVRATSSAAYEASPVVGGWTWAAALDRRTCPACWAMHGTVHPADEVLAGHPGCRCVEVPILARLMDRPPAPGLEPGEELFARLPADAQREILGPSKFEAYRSGEIRLPDLAQRQESERWGPMYREGSLFRARERASSRSGGPGGPGKGEGGGGPAPRPAVGMIAPWRAIDTRGLGRSPRERVIRGHVADALGLLNQALRLPDTARRITVESANLGPDVAGDLTVRMPAHRPIKMRLDAAAANDDVRVGTFVHEFGHYLDAGLMPPSGAWASHEATGLQAWREAIAQTRTVRTIIDLPGLPEDIRAYLLSPHELWARSFTQWVFARSRPPGYDALTRDVVHWSERDFAGVDAAITAYMRGRGWTVS
jgi:SPP1 gp7 family putative phage head morphogenesis protein